MLLTAFLQRCQLRPDAIALVEQERQLSYAELLGSANAIAATLQEQGITAGQPVAIHLERGCDAVAAIFGVLLAGACYVPLDLKNPASRLSYIVSDAHARLVLGKGAAPDWLAQDVWLDISNCPLGVQPQAVAIAPRALAAILYTSGSTGMPRGVAISHAAIISFTTWAANLLALGADDRIASSAPFYFDLSTFDLYAVLASGGSLYFLPSALTLAPARLSAWLGEQGITGWYTVPSLLAFLAYKGNLAGTALAKLRFLIFAGEVFPTPALLELAGQLPHTALYNFFGPTETNVCCYWPVDRERLHAEQPIPIGQAASDCELHIAAKSGELWVRGGSVASGYWREGRLQDFLNGEGWYASGDRVSLEQGEYHFHGRLGRMLKCAGYRVEPAEIEAVVNALPGVKACAVLGVDDPVAGQRPALVLSLQTPAGLADVRKVLAQRLPAYMQPARYLQLEDLPLLANGKLDFRCLAELLAQQA